MQRVLILIFALFLCNAANAAMYKCSIGGKTSYQDKPCANSKADENTVIVNAPKASATTDQPATAKKLAEYAEQTSKDNKRTDINYKIERLQREIKDLQLKMNADLESLRAKKLTATNNVAGATYEQSISTEMQAVTSAYDGQVKAKIAEIDMYRQQLNILH